MDFVDDVDLVGAARRGVAGVVAQVADLVDAVVGGAVDFDDVEAGAGRDFAAGVAGVARVRCRSLLAIEGLGEDAGGGGFSGAAGADEEVGVGEAFLDDRVAQGTDDVVLSKDVIESFGSVFSGEDLIAHGGECRDGGGFVMAEFSGIEKWRVGGRGKVARMSGYE